MFSEPDTFQIIINPSPVINPIADQILCEGDSTNDILTGGEANCIYYWSNDDSNIGIPFNGTGDILSLIAETIYLILLHLILRPTLSEWAIVCQLFFQLL